MNAIGTSLKDAYIITNQIFEDERGSFRESFNLRAFTATNLAINLGNIEYINNNVRVKAHARLAGRLSEFIIVVPSHNPGLADGELGYAIKHIFLALRIR